MFVGPLVMLDKLYITFYFIYFFNTFDVVIIIIMKKEQYKRISMARFSDLIRFAGRCRTRVKCIESSMEESDTLTRYHHRHLCPISKWVLDGAGGRRKKNWYTMLDKSTFVRRTLKWYVWKYDFRARLSSETKNKIICDENTLCKNESQLSNERIRSHMSREEKKTLSHHWSYQSPFAIFSSNLRRLSPLRVAFYKFISIRLSLFI